MYTYICRIKSEEKVYWFRYRWKEDIESLLEFKTNLHNLTQFDSCLTSNRYIRGSLCAVYEGYTFKVSRRHHTQDGCVLRIRRVWLVSWSCVMRSSGTPCNSPGEYIKKRDGAIFSYFSYFFYFLFLSFLKMRTSEPSSALCTTNLLSRFAFAMRINRRDVRI